jgi:hypothetical protein
MGPRTSFAERAAPPLVLWPADLAVVLGLGGERMAREFIIEHGVPHVRLGHRIYVLRETLFAFLREHEERRPTRGQLREKADETIRQIAPTARQRRRGRKPPRVRKKSLELPPAHAPECVECGSGPSDGPPARADKAAERSTDG